MMRKLHRVYRLPAALDARDRRRRCAVSTTRSPTCPSDRYPLAANEDARAALDVAARCLLSPRELAARATGTHALSRATGKRSRGGAAPRSRDAPGVSRTSSRSIARRPPGEEAIAWVERGEGDGAYEVKSAPFDVAEFLARRALRAHAKRRADECDAFDRRLVRLSQADARRRRSARTRRALAVRLPPAGATLHRAACTQSRKPPISRGVPRRLIEECLERTRGRAFVLCSPPTRACARCTRLLRERICLPDPAARRAAAHAAARVVPLDTERRAVCDRNVLGGHRRRRRCALVRDHRSFAVSLAARSARRGARSRAGITRARRASSTT